MRCKNYYKILSGNGITEPTGIKNWKNNFPDYFPDWEKKFSFIYKSKNDNKLRQFSFRLLVTVCARGAGWGLRPCARGGCAAVEIRLKSQIFSQSFFSDLTSQLKQTH